MHNETIAEILDRCLDDWINLPEVAGLVASQLPDANSDRLLTRCLDTVRQLLVEGLIEVGDLTGSGGRFRPWAFDPDATVKEIEQRWSRFGGPFDKATGEFVCWLSNTDKGDQLARHRTALAGSGVRPMSCTMASRAEQSVSRSLRGILADLANGASIPDSEQFHDALRALEVFVPEILAEVYSEWKQGGLDLDGVLPVLARKTGDGEAEIFGLCVLISDQTVTPLRVSLQVAASEDKISWLECRLGERGKHGMVRAPYESGATPKRLYALEGRVDSIEWVYKVTFGQRRV
jgi:hypothetical protein